MDRPLEDDARNHVWPAVVAPLLTVAATVWALGAFGVTDIEAKESQATAQATTTASAAPSSAPAAAGSPSRPSPSTPPEVDDPDPPTVEVDVPDVAGLTIDAASNRLVSSGLDVVAVVEDPAVRGDPATVVRTEPPSGTRVPTGTAVEIVTVPSIAEIPVPDVVGLTFLEATAVLTTAGLNGLPEPFTAADTATVVSQSPEAGRPAPPQSVITLFLS